MPTRREKGTQEVERWKWMITMHSGNVLVWMKQKTTWAGLTVVRSGYPLDSTEIKGTLKPLSENQWRPEHSLSFSEWNFLNLHLVSWGERNYGKRRTLSFSIQNLLGYFFAFRIQPSLLNSVYTTWSAVGWICGCGIVNTEEPRIQSADYKWYTDFPLCGVGAPNPCIVQGSAAFPSPPPLCEAPSMSI